MADVGKAMLWSTLASDCGLEGNQLPQGLRASIISLSIWVSKYSSQVARGEEDINALIDINKTIMEGLAMQSELQQAQSTQETIQTEGVTTQA